MRRSWGALSWGEAAGEVAAQAGMHATRLVESGFADCAIGKGIATREGLERVAEDLVRWGKREDAWLGIMNGEMVCFLGDEIPDRHASTVDVDEHARCFEPT